MKNNHEQPIQWQWPKAQRHPPIAIVSFAHWLSWCPSSNAFATWNSLTPTIRSWSAENGGDISAVQCRYMPRCLQRENILDENLTYECLLSLCLQYPQSFQISLEIYLLRKCSFWNLSSEPGPSRHQVSIFYPLYPGTTWMGRECILPTDPHGPCLLPTNQFIAVLKRKNCSEKLLIKFALIYSNRPI